MEILRLVKINREHIIGALFMAIPTLFWINLGLSQLFDLPFFADQLLARADRIIPFISAGVMFLLPFIACIMNLILVLKAYREKQVLSLEILGNIAIITYSGISVFALGSYFILENFKG